MSHFCNCTLADRNFKFIILYHTVLWHNAIAQKVIRIPETQVPIITVLPTYNSAQCTPMAQNVSYMKYSKAVAFNVSEYSELPRLNQNV